jgi:hypothetical protein
VRQQGYLCVQHHLATAGAWNARGEPTCLPKLSFSGADQVLLVNPVNTYLHCPYPWFHVEM